MPHQFLQIQDKAEGGLLIAPPPYDTIDLRAAALDQGLRSQGMTAARPCSSARDVSKHFGALAAVSQLSFEVAPGEILGIGGPEWGRQDHALRSAVRDEPGHFRADRL
jgi:hypothetical protein